MNKQRAPAVSLKVDDVVEVEADDDLVVRVEYVDAVAVDRHNDIITRQRRTLNEVCLEHCREVSRPDCRRTGYQLVLDLYIHVIHDSDQSHRSCLQHDDQWYGVFTSVCLIVRRIKL